MKTQIRLLFTGLALLAGVQQVAAQGARFFRISGPAATKIMAFRSDGTLVWSNAQPGATYTVQTVTALPAGGNWVDYVQLPVTTAVNTNRVIDPSPPARMVFIPAGVFTIGDALDGENDAFPTNVMVSAFYMDANLVTFGQWQPVYNWATNNGYVFDHAGSGKGPNYPVDYLNWYDCVKWCNARSQLAGLTPVYYTNAGLSQVYSTDLSNMVTTVYANWSANGYRLPTEAEWEKAARGGLSGQRFPWGDTIDWNHANYVSDPASVDPYSNFFYDLAPAAGLLRIA